MECLMTPDTQVPLLRAHRVFLNHFADFTSKEKSFCVLDYVPRHSHLVVTQHTINFIEVGLEVIIAFQVFRTYRDIGNY